MGSLPREPRLTDEEIVSRYVAGEGRTMVALRAKVSDQYVRDVLNAAGVELRSSVEGVRAAREMRMRQAVRRRAKQSLVAGSARDWPKAA